MRQRLRLFKGEECDFAVNEPEERLCSVKLGDMSRALYDACRWNRTWVSDFEDEEVQVSEDLYEVLLAYMRLRPGA